MKESEKRPKSRIEQVNPALVQDNQVLALSVNRQEVEQSTHFIREYGLLTPPVVGQMQDGSCRVLAGEREFLALREMGNRTAEAVVVFVEEPEEMDRLSLQLSTLRKAPNPLSEGMLVQQILQTGRYTQAQVGDLLGKSVSWVNKRLSLATRLQPAVRTLVTEKRLCAHSAQSIAKLPEPAQTAFAHSALREGLSKYAVETLVTAYNRPDTPASLQEHILREPRHALASLVEGRAVHCVPTKTDKAVAKELPAQRSLRSNLTLLLACMRDAELDLPNALPTGESSLGGLMYMCHQRCRLFASLLASKLPQLSPGKEHPASHPAEVERFAQEVPHGH